MKSALFNGSFDPITNGHMSVIERVAGEYDTLFVGVLINENKIGKFSLVDRLGMVSAATANIKNVVPVLWTGTTLELCALLNIREVIRGVRSDADIEYDKKLMTGYDFSGAGVTVRFVSADDDTKDISSTLVRSTVDEAELSRLVPESVFEFVKKHIKK